MQITIRQATTADGATISDILREAASWLVERGEPMWLEEEIADQGVRGAIAAGLFFLATVASEPAGILKFELADPLFWPDAADDGAYVHRLAVRRRFAGGAVSTALLQWAAERAARRRRRFLRLDCEADRPRLRAMYERFGFRYHSDRQVGPFFVARYEYPVGPFTDASG